MILIARRVVFLNLGNLNKNFRFFNIHRQLSDDESESFSSSSGAVAPAATVSTSSPSIAVHKAVRPTAAQEASGTYYNTVCFRNFTTAAAV